jgi:AcrR family transcriptional regulator
MYVRNDLSMRRTKEEAQHTRQQLLDAALLVFSRQGYDAARLEDIAAAASVTRGAIYHHFGGKPELFASLVEEASQTGSQAVTQAIQAGGSFLDIARRVLVFTLRLMHDNARYRQVMALLLNHLSSSPELDAMRQARVAQGVEQLHQIAGFFQMGIQQGAVRPDLDPEVAARAFLAYQNGLVLFYLSSPELTDVEQHAGPLAEVFVSGIAAR